MLPPVCVVHSTYSISFTDLLEEQEVLISQMCLDVFHPPSLLTFKKKKSYLQPTLHLLLDLVQWRIVLLNGNWWLYQLKRSMSLLNEFSDWAALILKFVLWKLKSLVSFISLLWFWPRGYCNVLTLRWTAAYQQYEWWTFYVSYIPQKVVLRVLKYMILFTPGSWLQLNSVW